MPAVPVSLMPPGNYLLTVSRGPSAAENGSFQLTLGAGRPKAGEAAASDPIPAMLGASGAESAAKVSASATHPRAAPAPRSRRRAVPRSPRPIPKVRAPPDCDVHDATAHTIRSLRSVVDDLQREAVPLVANLEGDVRRASAGLDRVGDLVGAAESVTRRVDGASRLAYATSGPPSSSARQPAGATSSTRPAWRAGARSARCSPGLRSSSGSPAIRRTSARFASD